MVQGPQETKVNNENFKEFSLLTFFLVGPGSDSD